MNEDRLNEIEALAQTKNDMYPFVVELVAEVRRLRDGCTELAEAIEARDTGGSQVAVNDAARRLALLWKVAPV